MKTIMQYKPAEPHYLKGTNTLVCPMGGMGAIKVQDDFPFTAIPSDGKFSVRDSRDGTITVTSKGSEYIVPVADDGFCYFDLQRNADE